MSFRLIPIDQFHDLDRKDIACALRLIEQEIAGTLALLATNEEARLDQELLDEFTSVLTLRKVFRLRLAELEAGEESDAPALPKLGRGPAPKLTTERYRHLTLQPALS